MSRQLIHQENMQPMRYIIASFLFLCSGMTLLTAQETGLPGEEVDVVKEFNARLIETDRVRVKPQLPPLVTEIPTLDYNISGKVLNVQYLPPKIRPLALDRVDQGPIYNGYARLGLGFPKQFLGEASYDFIDNEKFDIGLDARFHTADNSDRVENQQFSRLETLLSGTAYSDKGFAVDLRAGYDREVVHFYGYNDLDDDFDSELSFAADDVRQRFSLIHGGARLYNSEPTVGGIDYHAELDVYFLEDNYAARETGLLINIGGSKWFGEEHGVKVDLITDFTSYRDTLDQNLNNFFLVPSYQYHSDRFRVNVGVRVASHEDDFFFLPNIEGSFNVIENLLTAFVGVDGSIYKNNFRNLTELNPFLGSRNIVENSYVNKYYGGIKGEFLGMDYRAQVAYEDVDNLALFLSDRDSIPRFDVLYDTANVFTLSGEIIFPLLTNLELGGNVAYRIYDLQNQDKPWHLPSLTITGSAQYTMLDGDLKLHADVFLENGVPVRNEDGSSKNLNALFDLSAGGEYFFTDQISAFVQVNNLANNRRQRWRHYPVLGINGVAGVTARF